MQKCALTREVEKQLPKLRQTDERWRPSWDISADHSFDGRGGAVSINTDASKIIDAPLAEVISRAEDYTRRPFSELTEYRPFSGLVKERPSRALSALAFEARHSRYPTDFWRSALTDWPDNTSDRLRCLFATRLIRLPQQAVFDLRYDVSQWFQKNFAKLAQTGYQQYLPLWDATVDHFFALGPKANESSLGDVSVGENH